MAALGSSTAAGSPFEALAEDAIRSLQAVLDHDGPDLDYQCLARATRDMVAWRDTLIESGRGGSRHAGGSGASAEGDGAGNSAALGMVNSVLSLLVGAEFPLIGVRWKGISEVRDLLTAMQKGA